MLDASALINLLAIEPGVARHILKSHGAPFVVTSLVLRQEVLRDPRGGDRPVEDRVRELSEGLILLHPVEEDAVVDRFVELAATGGDGEAATIAFAETTHAIAVLDDTTARAAAVAGRVTVEWTTEVLLHPRVRAALDANALGNAVHDALRFGRMRVSPQDIKAVVDLVGLDRCRDCTSVSKALRIFESGGKWPTSESRRN